MIKKKNLPQKRQVFFKIGTLGKIEPYPKVQQMYALSLENLMSDFLRSGELDGGGSLVFIIKHDIRSSPDIKPAFARVAFANPILGIVLLSMMGCTTAPREDPAATMVMTIFRRRRK